MSRANVAPKTDATSGTGTFQPEVVLALIRSLRAGDREDDERALAELIQALDEDRQEGQKHFPDQDSLSTR